MYYTNEKGFNLVELLVVIGIIGLLTTLSAAAVQRAREKSNITAAGHDVDQIYKAIAIMANDTGEWPGHQTADEISTSPNNEICGPDNNSTPADCTSSLSDESSGILSNDTGTPYSNWQGPYMPEINLDPWGNEYFFDTDYSVHPDYTPCHDNDALCFDMVVVGSYGPDGLGRPTNGTNGAYGQDDIIKIIK